jgi:hypothetical protein
LRRDDNRLCCYDDIALKPHEFDLDIALGRGLDSAVVTALGPGRTSRILDGQSEPIRTAAAADIRAALASQARGASVPLGAAIWIVTAVNSCALSNAGGVRRIRAVLGSWP